METCSNAEWKERGDKVFVGTYSRYPAAMVSGSGCRLVDADGKEYLDFLSGIAVCILGHCHPAVTAAIAAQASRLVHVSNLYYTEPQVRLAEMLVANSFADKVFFCNSGAEANEAAIKLARAYFAKKGAPRAKFITALKSFHGRTLAAVTATGQEKYNKDFAPLPGGFSYVPYNDIAALEAVVDDTTCAVMLEIIQGEGGVIVCDPEYIQSARRICTEHGALLIIDEVQTGVGRTGTFFAFEQMNIVPDVVTLAKGLAGGVPIGAMLTTDEVATTFEPGDHGSTFGGNPLATAAAMAVLEEIDKKNLMKNANVIGDYFKKKLLKIAKNTNAITAVRGRGLLIGIELTEPSAVLLKKQLFEKGFLVGSIGDRVIRLAPPLILTKREASSFLSTLEELLTPKKVG